MSNAFVLAVEVATGEKCRFCAEPAISAFDILPLGAKDPSLRVAVCDTHPTSASRVIGDHLKTIPRPVIDEDLGGREESIEIMQFANALVTMEDGELDGFIARCGVASQQLQGNPVGSVMEAFCQLGLRVKAGRQRIVVATN